MRNVKPDTISKRISHDASVSDLPTPVQIILSSGVFKNSKSSLTQAIYTTSRGGFATLSKNMRKSNREPLPQILAGKLKKSLKSPPISFFLAKHWWLKCTVIQMPMIPECWRPIVTAFCTIFPLYFSTTKIVITSPSPHMVNGWLGKGLQAIYQFCPDKPGAEISGDRTYKPKERVCL